MTKLPEINFVETDADIIAEEKIKKYESLTGRTLSVSDPVRLFLLTEASREVQLRLEMNDIAKQNLLYYSRDSVLDHKGYSWSTERLPSTAATTTVRFTLSAIRDESILIPKGTVVTPDSETFFKTETTAIIPSGELTVDVSCISLETGVIGNGYRIGAINTLVNPLPYIQKVENITVSDGGADIEDDDSYRDRIHQAPEQLSTAGPRGAYDYHAKSVSSLIADVYSYSPAPSCVDIKILLENGELPSQEILDAVYEKVNDRKIRPLNDYVTVSAPEVISYDVDVNYYISDEIIDLENTKSDIETAIQEYITWQNSALGRDINPYILIANCMAKGAKRLEVPSPSFLKLEKNQVAHINTVNIAFGGVESD